MRSLDAELRQYVAAAPTGDYDATHYTHTPAGQLATVRDPGENVWRYGYDLRGRQTSAQDPDKGASTYRYDNANQLTSATDARDATVAYAYDALGRGTAVHENSLDGPKLAEWLYDTALFGRGQLASTTRWTNGHPYTVTTNGYSALYQPRRITTSIPQVEPQNMRNSRHLAATSSPRIRSVAARLQPATALPYSLESSTT